jgi:hypothetical protein
MVIKHSLINPVSDKPHGYNVYNMFILSAILAKESGYTVHLHGSKDVIDIIGKWYDSVVEVKNYDFKLYDDLKVKMWGDYKSDTFTMDGDVFVYKPFRLSTDNTISVEEFDLRPGEEVIEALRIFNSFGPSDIIPEWNYVYNGVVIYNGANNLSSYNTGVVRWGDGLNDFKRYYIGKYYELKNWFLENESKMSEQSRLLKSYSSVASHFICEHLLYQLTKAHKIKVDILARNEENHYKHLKGTNKFTNRKLSYDIETLLNTYIRLKQQRETLRIKDVYYALKKDNLVGEIFNFRN